MTVEVFWGSGSPFAWSVLLAFELKRVPYEGHLLSFSGGDLKTPAFLAMNPRGKVPVVKEGDFALAESNAILAWLDRKEPEPPLFGRTPEETGRIWRAVLEHAAYFQHDTHAISSALFNGEMDAKRDEVKAAAGRAGEELGRYEAALKDHPWLAGERISAADLVAYPHFELFFRIAGRADVRAHELGHGDGWSPWPALSAWRAKIQAINGYGNTYPPHWKG